MTGLTRAELAEQLAVTGLFDLLIIDINLGSISGIELYNRLKERGFSGEVLFITAYGDQYREEISGLDEKRLIQKPFKLYTVIERIKEITSHVDS